MRKNLLIAIACLVGICIGFSSCLKGDDEVVEMSASTDVTAFGIDTIYGKYYNFSIDQLNHVIFNADSLPIGADTLLNNIAIDTFSSQGIITSGLLDSILIVGNKADLTPAINKKGLSFRIYSKDGLKYTEYSLQINVHKQDPDSLTWKQIVGLPAELEASKATDLKVLVKGDELLILTEGNLLVRSDVSKADAYQWTKSTMKGLPADAVLESTLCYVDTLYMLTKSGDVYNSPNGETWQRNDVLSGGVKNLLAAFTFQLTAIREVEGQDVFCLTSASTQPWADGEALTDEFPDERISSLVYVSGTGVERAILVGQPSEEDEALVPWMTLDGDDWGDMSTPTDYYCPAMDHPVVMLYDGFFYIIGDDLETMYESIGGLVWGETVGKFQLPAAVKGHENYAIDVDDDDFIWLLVVGNDGESTQLWRGRLNELNTIYT